MNRLKTQVASLPGDSPDAPSDSRTRIAHIPEVIAKFRFHLSPPDLLPCIQVSRLWHDVFISALWETIDDTLFAWPTILQNHDSDEVQGHKDTDWINAVFAKYGLSIRHLRLSWPVMIEAAYAKNRCTRHLSLRILPRQMTDRQKYEPVSEVLYNGVGAVPLHRSSFQMAITGPILSPIFDGVLLPTMALSRSEAQQLRDWRITQVYWLLALANANLRTLVLNRALSDVVVVDSSDFIYDSLAKLPSLEQVDVVIGQPDINRLLEQQPNLKCFCNYGYLTGNIGAPTRAFSQIV
ncbi:hypothetical protein BGW39_004426 [Mortierella sp. 14UC]|nr:hypothetical protein BGW39_004426 [Mortierella sp. 14UC]